MVLGFILVMMLNVDWRNVGDPSLGKSVWLRLKAIHDSELVIAEK
jgi:hypothetical protein